MKQGKETGCLVELFLVAPGENGQMFIARKSGVADGDPDTAARKLLEPVSAHWLHSTSWRYEGNSVVLTYLAFCEDSNWGALSKECMAIGTMGQAGQSLPFQPRPDSITASDVLAHGLRHLGWLVCRAAENPWLSGMSAPTLAWLRSLDPQPAGKIS